MFSAFQTFGRLGASASAAPFSPTKLFAAGEAGGVWDFTTLANLYQDSAGTTPCTAVGDPIGKVLDTSGRGNHLTQSTSTKRPTLGRMPATGVRNLLVNTATLSTQNVTTTAQSYTIQFTGAGSVTASGTYSGTLTNGQTFTCTAGTLTLTVSGSVTNAQLEAGSTATAKQVVGAAYDITESGVASVYTAYFDGLDDCLVSPSIDFSGTDKMSVFGGIRTQNNGAQVVAELSASSSSNAGSFSFGAGSWVSGGDRMGGQVAGSSVLGYDSPANFAPPMPIVQTNLYDIAGSTTQARAGLRINGVLQSLSPGGAETTGSGNFGNYPLYVGQRNAATMPYKGFLSALAVRGAATNTAIVTSMEKWLAARTPGASL